jgi:hypothetical protein
MSPGPAHNGRCQAVLAVERTDDGLRRGEGVRSRGRGQAGTYRCSEATVNGVWVCGLQKLEGYGQRRYRRVAKGE